jgi:hypothetical protein
MKNYYNKVSRKKIRGWKRRIKQIDDWGESIKRPNIEWFERRGYTYERCYLHPFYVAEKRHPPMWFYKLIIAKFLTVMDHWADVFIERDKPYDLEFSLYDPSFIRSELNCWGVAEQGKQKRFAWESDFNKPFPYQKFASPLYNLFDYEWILADEDNIIFQSDIDYDDLDVNEYLADGYIKKVQGENEVYYAQRIGDIWIGRRKVDL